MADDVSKSWFCVFNNPEEHGYTGSPDEILEKLKNEWVSVSPTRTGAWTYCISAKGLHHVHMVLEDTKSMRFSAIKKSYAVGMHFEPTKGSKEQAEDYINKRGKYEEKGEMIVFTTRHGEIKGFQGSRRDIEQIEELILSGFTPSQIFETNFQFLRYEKLIRNAFWEKKKKDASFFRDVKVYWHFGESGTGKSYSAIGLADKYGRDKLYMTKDYDTGFLDTYEAEPILFLDEFRDQLRYSTLLSLLDGYTVQIHCRYKNVLMLWNEVHVSSVQTPLEVYQNLVPYLKRETDTFEQLSRRINYIVYHWKDSTGFHECQISMNEFKSRSQIESIAENDGFIVVPPGGFDLPFD